MSQPIVSSTILIVDDTPANLDLLTAVLQRNQYRVQAALSGEVALKSVQESLPDLILLDIMMPELDGYEVCRLLKQDDLTRGIPVIFISAVDDPSSKVKAFEAGGVDYITKPFRAAEVLARVQTHLTISLQQRQILTMARIKDQMLRTVSNSLKNPISLVMGYTEILQDPLVIARDPAQAAQMIKRVDQASREMNQIVQDLLEYSKLEQGLSLNLERTRINHMVRSSLITYQLKAEPQRIELLFEPGISEIQAVMIDSFRIMQAINNILNNALTYTPPGGKIVIRTSVKDSMLIIAVEDTGIGIPAEALPHVFDEFYRVPGDTQIVSEGAGLGLSIARAIVSQHNGRVWAKSQVGVGSTFFISLPLEHNHVV